MNNVVPIQDHELLRILTNILYHGINLLEQNEIAQILEKHLHGKEVTQEEITSLKAHMVY